jgi:Fe-S-cluster containining protein
MLSRNSEKSQLAKDAIIQVRQIYADLAKRPIDRNCLRRKDCCHFKLTGRTPHLTKGEAMVAAQALRRTGRTELPKSRDGICPLLDPNGDCLIYEDRPFGCRTHFCAAAGGPYGRNEVIDLIRSLENLDTRLGGDGPHKIEDAVNYALEEM